MAPLSLHEPEHGRYLSLEEREQIAAGLYGGELLTTIAAGLGRATSTVTREVKNHMRHRRSRRVGYTGRLVGIDWARDWEYSPSRAQHAAEEALAKPKASKLVTNQRLHDEVQDRLLKNHSPEQIARRLRVDFPNDPEMWVSHETIYQALYVQGRGALKRELTAHLRTGRSLRKPHKRPEERRGRMAGMVMISDRPPEVEDRAVPGHWEGDLILGTTASGSAVGTLVERTTRFVMLLHLPGGHTAEIVQEAMVAKMAALPEQLRLSLTWDQGSEMANHVQIAEATGMSIYFCDPHSPWQRGTNENTNGLLRQYLPKSTDLSFYGPGMLDNIAAELNARPRKTLNWHTPAEALTALLSDQPGPHQVAPTA
ncbi:IS30 family transposase [Nocardioides sp. BGMRC 2183]|nr:IS30 family transposase [Nocardioides sp. BGMRC 2183]